MVISVSSPLFKIELLMAVIACFLHDAKIHSKTNKILAKPSRYLQRYFRTETNGSNYIVSGIFMWGYFIPVICLMFRYSIFGYQTVRPLGNCFVTEITISYYTRTKANEKR